MSGIGRPDAVELRNAARDCTDRGLMVAARWAAEQLLAIPPELRSPSEEQVVDQENPESDRLDMARAYLQQKQFARAAHVLRQSTGNTACFVRGYAKFMAGEKYRADNCVAATKGEKCTEDITDLLELRDEVDAMLKQIGDGADGFMYYLKGIVLKSLDLADDARQALLQSVWLYPCNWSAWQDLGALCPDVDALNGMSLPSHWMTLFFHSYIWLDLQASQMLSE